MAVRTVSDTGGNWSATTAWVGGVVPIAGDSVVFTSTSGNLNVNSTTANLVGIDFTNYLGTITFNGFNINTSGTVNLGSGGYIQSGSTGLNINGTTTLISNGVTWSRTLSFSGASIVYTLSDDWNVTGNISFNGSTSSTLNGNTLNIGAGLTTTTTAIVSGNTSFVLNGTGTWSNSSTGAIRNNLTINTTGTTTISGNIYYNTGILSHSAGTVITTGSTLNISLGTTLNTSGITWNNFTSAGSTYTITLNSDLNITGTTTLNHTGTLSFSSGTNLFNPTGPLTLSQGTTTLPNNLNITNLNSTGASVINNNTTNVSGNLTINGGISGSTNILINGTSNQTWSSSSYIANNLTIDKSTGNFNISGTIYYSSGLLKHNNGNVITTGSTLTLYIPTNANSSVTLDTSGITWNNLGFDYVTQGRTITVNLNSDLNVLGDVLIGSSTRAIFSIVFTGVGVLKPSVTSDLRTVSTDYTSASLTLNSGITVNNLTFFGGPATNNLLTINGANINILGSLTFTGSAGKRLIGDGSLTMIGSGSLSTGTPFQFASTYYNVLGIDLIFNTSGTINVGSSFGFFSQNANVNTLTYSAGTVNSSSTNLYLVGANINCVLNTSGLTWNNAYIYRGTSLGFDSITLTSDLNLLGTLNFNNAPVSDNTSSCVINGSGRNINLGGIFINHQANVNISGTARFVFRNTGTWSQTTAVSISNPILFNSTGTTTVSGTVYYGSGSITYSGGTVITSGSTLSIAGSTNLNTNGNPNIGATTTSSTGVNWNNINFPTTINLTSNLTVIGTLTANGSTITRSSSENVYLGGNLTMTGNLTSTGSTIIMNGTGAWSGSGSLISSLTINTTGTTTISGIVVVVTDTNSTSFSPIITYTPNTGSVVTTGSTLRLYRNGTIPTINLNTSGFSWNNVEIYGYNQIGGVNVINLLSDLNVGGNLQTIAVVNNGLSCQINGLFNVNVNGNLTIGSTTTGTSTIIINGSGTQTWSTSYYLGNNLTINKPSGTLITSNNIYYQSGSLLYSGGTVDTTTNSTTLNIGSSCNLGTNPIVWYNLNTSFSGTMNLLSNLTWSNLWSVTTGIPVFSGIGVFSPQPTSRISITGNANVTIPGSITGYTFSAITITSSLATTLTGNLGCNGLLTLGGIINSSTGGTKTLNAFGDLLITNTTSGSVNIVFTGSTQQSWTHTSAVYLSNNVSISKTSGSTLVLGANIYYVTGTLTYTSGIVNTTTNSNVLNIGGTTILNTNGIDWFRFVCLTSANITLNSNFKVTNYAQYYGGTITHSGIGVLNITGDLYCGNLNIATSVTFTNTDLNIVNFFTYGSNGASTTINNGSSNINISGNYTVANNTNSSIVITCTPIRFVGSGTWSFTTLGVQYNYHNGNVTIDTSGVLTFGSDIYKGTGLLTFLNGDVNSNNKGLVINGGTYNVPSIIWSFIYVVAGFTLQNTITAYGTFTIPQSSPTILGGYTIFCGVLRFAFSTNGAFVINFSNSSVYTNDLLLEGAAIGGAMQITNTTIYVNKDLTITGGAGHGGHYYASNSTIVLAGTGVVTTSSALTVPLRIDTSGKITFSGVIYLGGQIIVGANGTTMTYVRGNVIASNATLSMQINSSYSYTLNNMNKIAWNRVIITSGMNILMNEFFCGNPKTMTQVIPTSTTNYRITFTDPSEKFAKFVKVSRATTSRNNQLTILTRNSNGGNNVGINFYPNQKPNGFAKNNPSVTNEQTNSFGGILSDPIFK